MSYVEYANIISFLRSEFYLDGCHSLKNLSKFLNKPQADVTAFVRYISNLGAPIQLSHTDLISLTELLDVYSKEKIQLACSGFVVPEIYLFLDIDSTNAYLKSLSSDNSRPSICIAELQTQGRGRRGKNWASPFASNVYFSYRKKIDVKPQASGCVSLITGLAIIKAIESLGFSGLQIKWPNDIYVNNKKLAGILIEVVSAKRDSIELVIGVGLNVKMPSSSSLTIGQPWIDLHQLLVEQNTLNIMPSRNEIVIALVNQLETNLRRVEEHGLSAFKEEWEQNDLLFGRQIKVIQENNDIYGSACGINEVGELLVKDEAGITAINAGEVSVRLS